MKRFGQAKVNALSRQSGSLTARLRAVGGDRLLEEFGIQSSSSSAARALQTKPGGASALAVEMQAEAVAEAAAARARGRLLTDLLQATASHRLPVAYTSAPLPHDLPSEVAAVW